MSNSNAAQKPSLREVLDHVALVVCQTRIVSPLRDTGEGKEEGARVSKVLQRCFDPKALRPVLRLKAEASRHCRTYGSRVETLNAWAVPLDRVEELMDYLEKVADQWNAIVTDLSFRMSDVIDDWVSKNPQDETLIRALAPTAEDVRSSTRFIYSSYRLRGDDVTDPGCLEMELTDLSAQALHEFAVTIRESGVQKNGGAAYAGAIRELLRKIAEKAQSLAFLSPVLTEVSSAIDGVLNHLPPTGAITGIHALSIKGLIDQLLMPMNLLKNGFPKVEDVASKVEEVPPRSAPVLVSSPEEVDTSAALAW